MRMAGRARSFAVRLMAAELADEALLDHFLFAHLIQVVVHFCDVLSSWRSQHDGRRSPMDSGASRRTNWLF